MSPTFCPAQAHQQDREGHEDGGGAVPDAGADSLPPSPSPRGTAGRLPRRTSF